MAIGQWGGPCIEGHQVYLTDRGGKNRIGQIMDVAEITWDRRRDEVSEAQIIITGNACSEQAAFLAQIEPKRHEIAIYRDSERVWEGPVWRVGWEEGRVEVAAHDVMEYLNSRPLSKTWDNTYPNTTEVTARLQEIIEYELTASFSYPTEDPDLMAPIVHLIPAWEALTPPINVLPHLVVHHWPNEARTSAKTEKFAMTVGEHLDNYARNGGIDYTVVGRAIHIWDVSRAIGQIRTLTEQDFLGPVIVSSYGADHASIAITVAEDGRWGAAGNTDDFYGPWTKIFTVYDEDESDPPTQADLDSQSKRNLYGRTPVPVEVRVPDNSTIRLTHDLTIDMLVPGVQLPLRATLNARVLSQIQKIDKVTTKETPDGETIQVTLIPATKPDTDEEEE